MGLLCKNTQAQSLGAQNEDGEWYGLASGAHTGQDQGHNMNRLHVLAEYCWRHRHRVPTHNGSVQWSMFKNVPRKRESKRLTTILVVGQDTFDSRDASCRQ